MLIAQWGLCVTWFPEIKYPREKVIQLLINFCVTTQQDSYFFMLRDWRERKQILRRLYPAMLALFGFEFACTSIIIEHLVSLLIRESMFYSLEFLIRKTNLLQSAIWDSTATVRVCRDWTWHHAVCDMPVFACVGGCSQELLFFHRIRITCRNSTARDRQDCIICLSLWWQTQHSQEERFTQVVNSSSL